MFEILTDRLQDVFDKIGRKGRLTEADVQELVSSAQLGNTATGTVPKWRMAGVLGALIS